MNNASDFRKTNPNKPNFALAQLTRYTRLVYTSRFEDCINHEILYNGSLRGTGKWSVDGTNSSKVTILKENAER
jgi:hypothetical protein